MKSKCSTILKASIALVLTILMVLGSVSTVLAATVDMAGTGSTECTIYIYPADLWSDYASYTIKSNANIGDNNTWVQKDFSDTGRTINGKVVYSATFTAKYNGVDALQIQKYQGSTWKDQKVPYSSWTTAGTFNGKIYNGTSWAAKPNWDAIVTQLDAPTLKCNNATTSPVTLSSHTTVNLTWASVTNASSYSIYKGGSLVASNVTSPYTVSETGNYTVKAIGDGTTYSDSDASNAIQVNIPIEFYVHNTSDWDFSKMKYYLYGGSGAAGAWEGTSMSGDTKTEWIGTSGDHDVYKVTIVTDDSYIILIESGSKQTKGDNDSNSALAHGKVYTTVGSNKASTTSSNFSDLVLDAVKYDVSISSSISNGTVTANVAKAAEGATVTLTATPSTGYQFSSWNVTDADSGTVTVTNNAFTMPAKAVTVSATFTKVNYAITYPTGTGYSITNKSHATTANYNDSVSFKVSATSGYRIKSVKYTPAGGSATTITPSSGTYSFTMPAKAVTVSVVAVQTHTVTITKSAGGTLSSDAALTVDHNTATQLPNATPNQGYKFTGWTVTTGTATLTSGTSASGAKVTATTDATVKANFALDDTLNLYIAGRFHIKDGSNWVNSFDSNGWSNTGDDNIKFTWDASVGKYKVDTGASMAELSSDFTEGPTYFFVYNASASSKKYYYSATKNFFTASNTEANLTAYSSTDSTKDVNVKFDSTSTDSPVTIYFDATTNKLSYSIPNFYDVTVATATGGSVTASPARVTEGATVTLTVTKENGYSLKSLTAKDSSNAAVTLTQDSQDASKYTFTMPAKAVTVTPVFEEVTYTGLSAVGKYTNDGTNFDQDMPTQPTKSAASGTYATGITVTAPVVTGYEFVEWMTTSGSFADKLENSTTFKPNADGATATAKYRKIHTITYSVDSESTGIGTVAIANNASTVVAGGSYTINATAGTNSVIESIKVNGTNRGTNASTNISSVDANQTVVVKFKSTVAVIGGLAVSGWTEPGDAMKSNADATKYTYAITKVAGTYNFKLYKGTTGGTYVSATDIATKSLVNATLTIADDGQNTGDKIYNLKLNAESIVTLESDGSKFTSITVIPKNATKYGVTFKKVANSTITGTYMGESFTTADADATVQVYSGTDISFTVTAAGGKYISGLTGATFTPAFSEAATYTGKITNVTGEKTVTPTVGSAATLNAVTNKSAYGTVSLSKSAAIKGDEITITVSPKNGQLTALTLTYESGLKYSYDFTNDSWTLKAGTPAGSGASLLSGKGDFAATGAAVDAAATGADSNYTFTMAETSNVTVNAEFSAYSGDSDWYYNGYDTGGNAKEGYYSKQMTEAMIGGAKYSYYHVTGRDSEAYEQLFTVSKKTNDLPTTIYFTRPNSGGWESHGVKAYFFGDNGDVSTAWPGNSMTYVGKNDYNEDIYSISVPANAKKVIFNNENNGVQSPDITLSTDVNAYYLSDGNVGSYVYGSLSNNTEYYKNDSRVAYSDNWWTGGFNNHNTSGNDYAKPKDGNDKNFSDCDDDYYIVVLYAGVEYTFNNNTQTPDKPYILWMADLPGGADADGVKVYAKDGAIRGNGSTLANIADTKIYKADGSHSGNSTDIKSHTACDGQTYETYNATKGETITIKTTIANTTCTGATDTYRQRFYVRGFVVNGEVPSGTLITTPDTTTGEYTLEYTIPEDFEGNAIEITPVYYLVDSTDYDEVTFRVTGFTDDLKEVGSGKPGWGDTLYAYAYYGKLGSTENAFGQYPGQPLIYYNGQYSIQIPVKSSSPFSSAGSSTDVAGITMSNGYYDTVHKTVMGYGNNASKSDHVQTYDYDDFYKIYHEKSEKIADNKVDNIVYDFKYRTTNDNKTDLRSFGTSGKTTQNFVDTFANGFEDLKNFHGNPVNIYGNVISDSNASTKSPLYVVSLAGPETQNEAGYYATEWAIFAPNDAGTSYTRITGGGKDSIPPALLLFNDDTSFSDTAYTTATSHEATEWQALYSALADYTENPVKITYEKAKAEADATRNDGRWLYSSEGESITSNIKIQTSTNGTTWTDNPAEGEAGHIDNLEAYFTNEEVEGKTTYSTTINSEKTFDFTAKTSNPEYRFVGWYMADGTRIATTNDASTERSGSYTFIARFRQVSEGTLTLRHNVGTDSTYTGTGVTEMKVVVKEGTETIRTYDRTTNDITLDEKIVKNTNNYDVYVTLYATPSGVDYYNRTELDTPSGQESKYYNSPASSTDGLTEIRTFQFNIATDLYGGTTTLDTKSLIYKSYFEQSTFFYKFNFVYRDRNNVEKTFARQGYLTNSQIENENIVRIGEKEAGRNKRYLMPAFIQTIAPFESNFNQDIKWQYQADGYKFTVINHAYKIEDTIMAEMGTPNTRTVSFDLPYAYDANGAAVDDGSGNVAKATSENLTITDAAYGEVPQINDEYILAPDKIVDGGSTLYFQYWEVRNTADDETIVAKSYDSQFGLVVMDNYYIKAVYGADDVDKSSMGKFTDIKFLETSRNQFNDDNDRSSSERTYAADLLYNDFAITYAYDGVDIYKNDTTSSVIADLGIVVERIKQLDLKQDGTRDTTISKYTGITENTDTVKGIINDSVSNSKFTKTSIAKTSLSNKNRIELYNAFYNSAGWKINEQEAAKEYGYKNYVYRAYSYMKLSDGTIILSETPAYFTMYDIASIKTATSAAD